MYEVQVSFSATELQKYVSVVYDGWTGSISRSTRIVVVILRKYGFQMNYG